MTSDRIEIRRYRAGDEARIIESHNRLLGGERSLDEWSWLYPDFSDGRAIVFGEAEGSIVAHCGGRRTHLRCGGRSVPAVIVQDVFARPAGALSEVEIQQRVILDFLAQMQREGRSAIAFADAPAVPATATVSVEVTTLHRQSASARSPRRLFYRAELARDWEPRLDTLWTHAASAYPVAQVRDAEYALPWFAAHPSRRFHRFLIFPRFGRTPVAWVVFVIEGGECRCTDLVWDHRHPGAMSLVSHLSLKLARQFDVGTESITLGGDPAVFAQLERHGFEVSSTRTAKVSFVDNGCGVPDAGGLDRFYLTRSDLDAV